METFEERRQMGIDTRETRISTEKGDYGSPVSGPLTRRDNYITTDACNKGLGATLWQKEGEVFRPAVFASIFLTDKNTLEKD